MLPFEKHGWRKTIANSGIPAEAQQLVTTVVKKSRLLRFEKIDVVQELVAHFIDGESAGKSVKQLITDFGDPLVTAQLIHHSKKRNRPVMFKIAKFFGWFLLALSSAYLIVFGYFHSATPSITTDYMVDLNRPNVEADENDKAWPIYRDAWIKFGLSTNGIFKMDAFWHGENENPKSRLAMPGDESWPQAVAKLDDISELLDALRTGAKKPILGLELQANPTNYAPEDFKALFPGAQLSDFEQKDGSTSTESSIDDSVVSVLLPHVQSFRGAARIFKVDTRWAVEQNDSERALENVETVLGFAAHAADSNVLVGSLVGIAISGIAFDIVEEVLVEHPDFFNDEQLAKLQATVERISVNEWIKFDGERAFFYDIVQRIYSDDGKGGGRITPAGVKTFSQFSGLLMSPENKLTITGSERLDRLTSAAQSAVAPAAMFVMASRSELTHKANEYYDYFESAVHQPRWEREPSDLEEFLDQNQIRFAILGYFVPSFDSILTAMDRTIARQEAVIAALTTYRYFATNGEWPNRLEDVAPDFIDKLPVDQINGEPIRMTIENDAPLFYSVGNDGDDDGGLQANEDVYNFNNTRMAPHRNYFGGSSNHETDTDWILWPQLNWKSRIPAETK